MIWNLHRSVSLGTLIVYLLSLIHPVVLLGDTPKDLVLGETVADEFSRAALPACADEGSLERMVRETAQAIAVCGGILRSLPNGASLRRDFEPHLHELPGRLAALHDRCNALLNVQEREEGPRADRGRHRKHLREKLANWYAQTRGLLMELRDVREPERAHHLLDALRQEVVSVVHSGAAIPASAKKVLPASRRPRSWASFATGSPHEDVHRKYAAKGASQTDAELLVVPAVESFPAVLALYQQIRNGLRYEPYYGSRKGGDATIAEDGGNDFDTAAALVNGLRKIHIDARYVYGTVHIPAEDVMNWVGGADTAEVALTILEKSGIPAEGLPEAGPYTTISMEHLWVEACLPSNTTGADPNLSAETEAACEWRALDPSFKLYEYVPGIQWDQFNAQYPVDVFLPVESMNLNLTKGYASGLNGALLGEELFRRADALKAYLADQGYPNPTPGDVLGHREIIPDTSSDLPASLPYEMASVLWRSPEIPDDFRDAMTIDWYKSPKDNTSSLSRTLYLDEIDGEVLSLYYMGDKDYDAEQLAAFDGSNYGLYITVRPVLQLGTQVLGTSDTGNFMGSREHLAVTYDLANGSQSSYDVDISAGSYYVFGFDLGRIPLPRIERRMADLRIGLNNVTDVASYTALFSPEIMGNTLTLLADGYYLETAGLLAQQAGIEHIIRVNQVKQGLFKWTLDVSYIFGIPLGVKGFGRPCIDLRRSEQSVFSAAGNSEAERSFRVIAGATGSYMEGQIIEQTFGHPALSTVHVFQLANDAGMKIHVVDQSNVDDKLIELNQFLTIKEMIAEEVGKGKLVIIPEGEVSLAGSQYSGMAVIDPNDGSGFYWIFNYLTAAGGLSAIDSPLGPLLLFLLETISPVGLGLSAPYLSMGVWLPIGFALATLGYPLLGLAAVGLAAWAGYNQFSNLFNGLFDPIVSALGNLPGGSGAVPPASGSHDTGTAQKNRTRHLLSQMTLSQTLETQMRSAVHRASGLSRPDPYALHPVRDYLIQAVVDNGDQFSHFLETFQSTYGGEIFSSMRSDLSDEQLVELAIDCVDFRSLYELKEYLQALPEGQAFFEAFIGSACSDSSYATLNQVKNWPKTVQGAFADWLAIEYPSRMGIPRSDWMVHNARQLGDKSMRSTSGVAVDANGVVYLTDSGSEIVGSLIDKWPKYSVTFTFGGPGTEPKAFKALHGVAVSSTGTVYVADTGNHRVQVFDTLGNVLNIVGEPGNAAGQLLSPRGLCLGRSGRLYVADTGNHRVCVFDTDGAFVREFGGYGDGAGNLKRPQGVAVDDQGFVYVADTGNHRIVKFTTEGDWLWSVGAMGYAQGGEFITPRGISIGEDGHVYVCDTYTYRIQEFDTDGEFLNAVTDAHFLMPADLAFNPANDSRLVANDGGNTRIYRDDWKERFYFYGSEAFQQWVDFAYRQGQQGAVRIVEFIVTEEVLQPEDFDHYIEYVQGEYHFATQDILYWSLGSTLIHPQVQAEILEALSGDRLVLEIRIASAIEDPLSPELVALDGTTIPAYDWLSGDFMGNVLVDLHVE